jgi:hypothetical protein
VSPLAEAAYEILRLRLALPDPRIPYAELAEQLRDASEEFEAIYPRSRELYTALGEIGDACRSLGLPPLPALVVRADTRRPGAAYYAARFPGVVYKGERVAAWQEDLEAVKRATYPPSVAER